MNTRTLTLVLAILATFIGTLTVSMAATPMLAYSPDPTLLQIKGYSPQIIDAIGVQTQRQEWIQPPPRKRTLWEQVKHNIFLNDFTGNFDDFGSQIIRERQ